MNDLDEHNYSMPVTEADPKAVQAAQQAASAYSKAEAIKTMKPLMKMI